jgi:hypothetical protein
VCGGERARKRGRLEDKRGGSKEADKGLVRKRLEYACLRRKM